MTSSRSSGRPAGSVGTSWISISFMTGPSWSTRTRPEAVHLPLRILPASETSGAPDSGVSRRRRSSADRSKPHWNAGGAGGDSLSQSIFSVPPAAKSGTVNETRAWRTEPSGALRSTSTWAASFRPPMTGVTPRVKSPAAPTRENVTGTFSSALSASRFPYVFETTAWPRTGPPHVISIIDSHATRCMVPFSCGGARAGIPVCACVAPPAVAPAPWPPPPRRLHRLAPVAATVAAGSSSGRRLSSRWRPGRGCSPGSSPKAEAP